MIFYYSAGIPLTRAFRRQDRNIQTLLDELTCSGNETNIDQCNHDGWGQHDCGSTEDVGVYCYRGQKINY